VIEQRPYPRRTGDRLEVNRARAEITATAPVRADHGTPGSANSRSALVNRTGGSGNLSEGARGARSALKTSSIDESAPAIVSVRAGIDPTFSKSLVISAPRAALVGLLGAAQDGVRDVGKVKGPRAPAM
jgi:hypothetical protein